MNASSFDTISQVKRADSNDGLGMLLKDPNSEQALHLLQTQKTILENIVQGHDLTTILNTLCIEMEKVLFPSLCSIMLLDEPTGRLHVRSAPNMPNSLYVDLDKSGLEKPTGSCGIAIQTGKVAVIVNSETDPHWDKIRERADKHGIQACWSIPIVSKQNTPVGTVALSYQQLRRPTAFDLHALETAASLAGYAIQRRKEEHELQASHERLQSLFDSAPVAYFTSTMDGIILSANSYTAALTGIPQDKLPGRPMLDLYSPTLRGRKKAERIHKWINHGLEVEGEEIELERPDGTRRWVSLTVRVFRDSLGNPVERRGILEDISNRKQAEHLLDHQKSILEMIARGQPLHQTLSRLCEGIETLSPDIKCSIHQLEGSTLTLLAAPSFPESYTSTIATLKIGPAVESCGTAAYRREVVVVSDIATDPLWKKGRTLALTHGLQACWAHPIFSSNNEVLGTMAMYYPQPRTPSNDDWQIIESSTKLAGIALEQERDRAALTQSETRYRILYEDNPSMYFTVALDGTVRSVNQFGASQLGFTPSELLGTSVFSLCHKNDQATVRHHFESYLQAPSDLEYFECRKVRKDGTVIWVRETIRLVQSTEQESVLLLVCEDITKQKRGEKTVELTQHVFDILPDHVSIVGSDYRYRRVNAIYEQVHGLPAQEFIGKHISDLLGKQTFRHDIKPHFDRCLAGERVSYEQWFQFPNGQTRFMAVTYSPLRSQDSPHEVEAVVVNSRDLTPRKQMEEALKDSEGHLRILLDERTRISQDLHDHVLQSVYALGLIIAAIRKPLEKQKFSEVYDFLDQAVSQVNHAIADIRGFIEGLPQDEGETGDFTTELKNLIQSMSLPNGPTFRLRIDPEAAALLPKDDSLHLLSIARESMSNCLRHAQASKGSISLTRRHGKLRFEVRDNGIGFNYQEGSHSGHGLLNMKSRSEYVHGTIVIRSAPQKGTRVIIDMPSNTQRK